MSSIHKLIQQYHNNIDLFEKEDSDNVENKTNIIINKCINDLMMNLNGSSVVILHHQDDIPSLVCYTLLKIAQTRTNFTLYIYGKRKFTKSKIDKEDKFINRWKAKRLLKSSSNSATLIIPFSPLYEVLNVEKNFNQFINDAERILKPIETFNYDEIICAASFYKIGYIKNCKFNLNVLSSTELSELRRMYMIDKNDNHDIMEMQRKSAMFDVIGVWLTGDIKEDTKTINKVEDADGLMFYYYDKTKEIPSILYSGFELWLKKKANKPMKFININMPYVLNKDIPCVDRVFLVGKFPNSVKNAITHCGYIEL